MSPAHAFHRTEFSVSLGMVSPFLFRGLPGKLMGLDATTLRDEQGRAIIPADQIRGVLRDAFEDLAAAGAGLSSVEMDALFGMASKTKEDSDSLGDNLPIRTNLIISDFVDEAQRERGLETTRIEIDDVMGAVESAKMQVLELVAPVGTEVMFRGRIVAFLPAQKASLFKDLLHKALLLVRRMGMAKSSGFGRIVKVDVQLIANKQFVLKSAVKLGKALGVRRYSVIFDRPLLANARRIADNAIEGGDIIPGAVLKGALARRLELAGAEPNRPGNRLGLALEKLVIGHAFPAALHDHKTISAGFSDAPSRPSLPLSLVADNETVCDALTNPGSPGYCRLNPDREKVYPRFQSDWKRAEWTVASANLSWFKTEVPKLARTHTAIDHEGVAAEAKVFSTLARSNIWSNAGKWTPRPWIVDIDITEAFKALPDETAQLIAVLEEGLESIGKTQASANFTLLADQLPVVRPFQPGTQRYAIVLRTPAYLIDGASLSTSEWENGPKIHYESYFAQNFAGARLIDFFAEQSLYGRHLSRRYRIDGAYYPFLLTEPGSVFLIEVDAVGLQAIHDVARRGLPAATIKGQQSTWQNCPFMPENGYGHVWTDYEAISDPKFSLLEAGRAD